MVSPAKEQSPMSASVSHMDVDTGDDGHHAKRARMSTDGGSSGVHSSSLASSSFMMEIEEGGEQKPKVVDSQNDKYTVVKAAIYAQPIVAEKKAAGKLDHSRGDTRVQLQSNFVPFKAFQSTDKIYLYEVVIEGVDGDKKAMKNIQRAGADDAHRISRRNTCFDIMTKVLKRNPGLFDDNTHHSFCYDRSRMLYSTEKLSGVGANKQIEVVHPTTSKGSYNVTVRQSPEGTMVMDLAKFAECYASRNLDKQDHSIEQFIEIATSQHLYKNSDYVAASNRVFYRKEEKPEAVLRSGTYVAHGFTKSAKFTDGGLMLCVEPRVTAMFYDSQVLDLLCDVGLIKGDPRGYRPSPRDVGIMTNQLRGLRVQSTHRQPFVEFQVAGISMTSADAIEFSFEDKTTGRKSMISVAKYFARELNKPLKFPNLPCIVQKKMFKGERTSSYFPLEVCRIMKYQRVTVKQQTPDMQRFMIKKSAVHPEVRVQKTMAVIREDLQLSTASLMLQTLKLEVSEEMCYLEGRKLGDIRLQYANDAKMLCRQGKWEQGQAHFIQPADCRNYGIVVIGQAPMNKVWEMEGRWKAECERRGMRMGASVYPEKDGPFICRDERMLEEAFKDLVKHGAQFALFVIPNNTDTSKQMVKYFEAQYALATQCITVMTLGKLNNNVLGNICMKTNMKNGGLNYVLDGKDMMVKMYLSDDVMVMSYDVSKPPPLTNSQRRNGMCDSEPSVVGMSATTEERKNLATIDYRLQPGRHEEVIGLTDLTKTMLKRYGDSHKGRMPGRFLIFRDGVSEGEYAMVLSNEVPRIEKAIEEMRGDKKKFDITFIVCTKRHDARFFLENIPTQARSAAQKNIPAGTVIDTKVTSASLTEFYLCSHVAFQGTAKAIKYTVLKDTANMKLEHIQTLTWMLAHGHQIITATVSKPHVCMSATIAAMRGRALYMAHSQLTGDTASMMSGASVDQMSVDRLDELTQKLKVKDDAFANRAYYA